MVIKVRQSLHNTGGLTTAVGSAAAFGISGSLATSLFRTGWSPGAAVATRLLIAALTLTIPALLMVRGRMADVRAGAGMIGAYGLLAVAGAQLCYFQALQYLSVPVALLLEYSGTVLVVGWMWARHRQIPTPLTGGGAVTAAVGLCLALGLTGHQHVSLLGVLWGLGAAVGLARYFVVSADDATQLPPLVIAWGGLVLGAAGALVMAFVGLMPWRSTWHPARLAGVELSPVLIVIALGVVAGAIAYVTGIAGARRLGARLSSFVGLAEVLFAAVYARFLLGEQLGPVQLAGAVLVLVGVALVRAGERTATETAEAEPDLELAPAA